MNDVVQNGGKKQGKLANLERPQMLLLSAGILTRCLVYCFLSPDNNDPHVAFVQFLVDHKAFAGIHENSLAFHPPLFYLIAAPVLALTKNAKALQCLSLAISIATLIVLYQLIYKTEIIPTGRLRVYCLGLASFLPQFVLFGLYVSDDSLSYLLGCMTVMGVWKYLETPSRRRVIVLAVLCGLGLLTKATFLAFLPILIALVVFVQFREQRTLSKAIAPAVLFLVISSSIGCYKFVDNYIRYRNPLINEQDVTSWWSSQVGSYHGLGTYFDFNVLRLVAAPKIPSNEMSQVDPGGVTGSYSLVLYGSLWYDLIPENNFSGDSYRPFSYIGSAIYLVGLVPTALFLIGVAKLAWRMPGFIRSFNRGRIVDCGLMCSYVSCIMLCANVALIFAAVAKYHSWSIMQGRLLFPCITGMLVAFAVGAKWFDKSRHGSVILKVFMMVLMGLFGLYFLSEIAYIGLKDFAPSVKPLIKSLVS